MTLSSPPLLVALGTHAELSDFIADAATESGFEALSVCGHDAVGLRVATAAADVLVLDTDTARRELAAMPAPESSEDAPVVVLLVSPDGAEAALARDVIATRGMRIVATVQAPLVEETLLRALATARADVGQT